MTDRDPLTVAQIGAPHLDIPIAVPTTTATEQHWKAARPTVLFVMGLGRSGTSALTRVLSLCGAALPSGMLGATSSNTRGNWEPRAAIHLNEAILHHRGSSAYDPSLRGFGEEASGKRTRAKSIFKIRAYLATLPDAPCVVLKEGRITLLSDLWFEAARLAGFDVVAVVAVRHPREVIASMDAHIGASPELSSALWLKYALLAERQTRTVPRVFVNYANLLESWRREVKRISVALRVDLRARNESAVDEFVDQGLRHQRQPDLVPNYFGADWISAVYEAMSAAARDEAWDESALDQVFGAYRLAEHSFRTAFEDFHDHFSGLLFRPVIMKAILEGFAIVNRRRATWA